MKVFGLVIGILVAILCLTWIVQGNNFFMYKFFGIKYENTRREIFEQSKAYNQGMIQELQNMQFEYIKAKEEQKPGLASIILHRAADYDVDKLPIDLRQFISQLKTERSKIR
jgi:hypothetical protein